MRPERSLTRSIHEMTSIASGSTYARLLRSLMTSAPLVGLYREGWEDSYSPGEIEIVERLRPRLVRIERVRGFEVDYEGMERHVYQNDSETINALVAVSNGIYDWQFPGLPIDLHLMRSDGSTVLMTVATHERGWVEMSSREWKTWSRTLPADVLELFDPSVRLPGQVSAISPFADCLGHTLEVGKLLPLVGRTGPERRQIISDYLRSGAIVVYNPGETADLLEGHFQVTDGADLLTDGFFVWRRDAAEYVEHHGIGLPEAAILHFEESQWSIPRLTEEQIEDIENFVWF